MILSEILHSSRASSPDSHCVVYQEAQQQPASYLTYDGAYRACQRHQEYFQHIVQDRCGKDEVVVAFLAQNSADLFLATIACTEIGNVLPVLLNTRWSPSEMAQAIKSQNESDATILVHDDENSDRMEQVARLLRQNHSRVSTSRLSTISTSFRQTNQDALRAMDEQESSRIWKTTKCDSETALILFTSGTTSGAKGVLLSHKALSIQAHAKLKAPCGYDSTTRMLATTVPLFHVGGLSSALAVLMAGGSLVFSPLTQASGFQPQTVLRSLQQGPQLSSNTLVVVPAMLSSMMSQKQRNQTYPSVQLVLIGGQSASFTLLQQCIQTFPNARIVQTYACTEAASSLTFWQRHPAINSSDSLAGTGDCIGRPPGHIRLCLFPTADDAKQSNETKEQFTLGVIATRGPHVLTGYWRRGSSHSIFAHESPLTPSGWFVSNDLGYQDAEGRFYFSGRVADVIRTGGETVLATEVERILLQHDAIAECAVFALPDDKFGETVCAAVVLKDHQDTINLNILRNWCADKGLAGYKRPRRLFFMKALPRNSSGKLLKRLLVERFSKVETTRSKL